MSQQLKLDQKVKAKRDLIEYATGDNPGDVYAKEGDTLVIRAIDHCAYYGLSVSHENITDSSFKCNPTEIEPI